MAAPKQNVEGPAGVATTPSAPPSSGQSEWVPPWLRSLLQGKEVKGKETGGLEAGVSAAAGGGLKGFVLSRVASGAAGAAGAIGHVIPSIPLAPYLAGGYAAYRLFLRPGTAPSLPPGAVHFAPGAPPAPLLIKNRFLNAFGRFFVGPTALVLTGIGTVLRKTVFKKTENENLIYPVLAGIFTVGTEEPIFGGLRVPPSVLREFGIDPGAGLQLAGLVTAIGSIVAGLEQPGEYTGLPVWEMDP